MRVNSRMRRVDVAIPGPCLVQTLKTYPGDHSSFCFRYQSWIDPELVDFCRAWASIKKREEVVKLLLAHPGVNPEAQDVHGKTALQWAKDLRHGSIEQLLCRMSDYVGLSKIEQRQLTTIACPARSAIPAA
jgi:hypothetical protein